MKSILKIFLNGKKMKIKIIFKILIFLGTLLSAIYGIIEFFCKVLKSFFFKKIKRFFEIQIYCLKHRKVENGQLIKFYKKIKNKKIYCKEQKIAEKEVKNIYSENGKSTKEIYEFKIFDFKTKKEIILNKVFENESVKIKNLKIKKYLKQFINDKIILEEDNKSFKC